MDTTGRIRATLVALGAVVAAARAPAQGQPSMALTPCQVAGLAGDVRCGSLEVFENRDTRQGRRISVHVVVARATGADRAPDPLFLFAGGPGQASSEMGAFATEAFGLARERRDLVMVDARGTGRSHRLGCRLYLTPRAAFGDLFPAARVRACADSLSGVADLTQYTTERITDDIDEVRAALGYQRINIYGTSFGTRLGLVFARRHPASVRAMVLKSVAPTDMAAPMSYARDGERAWAQVVRDCGRDAACAAAYPSPDADLRSALRNAELGRLRAALPGAPGDTVTVTRDALGGTILGMMQSMGTRAMIPAIVHRAAAGDASMIADAVGRYRAALDAGIAIGMHFSVMCAEDTRQLDAARAAREDGATFLADARVRSQIEACRNWPTGRVSDGYFAPVSTPAPVLLVSGDLDPNTPPRWAEHAATTLPNARHVLLPTVAHGWHDVQRCGAAFVREYLERADARAIDASCAAGGRIPPFLIP
jgi:pimeloyl-ACP methyl ester carboxylesterase